ncbi:hypothetical protein XENORESO_006775 [Xenotaenia resolanae]|uniref:Uncharacterized protein n=1 Tax=Xenotaenia resolanae TaxID=208358 RepID=A0ABV0W3Z1_9TELE
MAVPGWVILFPDVSPTGLWMSTSMPTVQEAVRVKAHSTRCVSASWAAMKGVPLEAICAAASWASLSTFARFYNVNVATHLPLGQVLWRGSAGPSRCAQDSS